jgi:hypothetical protein
MLIKEAAIVPTWRAEGGMFGIDWLCCWLSRGEVWQREEDDGWRQHKRDWVSTIARIRWTTS